MKSCGIDLIGLPQPGDDLSITRRMNKDGSVIRRRHDQRAVRADDGTSQPCFLWWQAHQGFATHRVPDYDCPFVFASSQETAAIGQKTRQPNPSFMRALYVAQQISPTIIQRQRRVFESGDNPPKRHARSQNTDILPLPPECSKLPAGRGIKQTGRPGMPDQKPPAIRAEQEPAHRFRQRLADKRLHKNPSLIIPRADPFFAAID